MAKDENQIKIDRILNLTTIEENQDLLSKIGLSFRTLTLRRTRKGKDIDGKSFKPYTKPYARIRAKAGEPTSPVNLTMDHVNGMLESVKTDYSIKRDGSFVEAWINDSDKSEIGYYHAVSGAGTNRVVRKWWGLSAEDEEAIRKTIDEEFDKYIQTNVL